MFAQKSLSNNYHSLITGFFIKIYKSRRCFDKEGTSFILDGGNVKNEKLKMGNKTASLIALMKYLNKIFLPSKMVLVRDLRTKTEWSRTNWFRPYRTLNSLTWISFGS